VIKTCKKCNCSFPATEEFFYKDSRKKGGLIARCKKCKIQERLEKYREENKYSIIRREEEYKRIHAKPGHKICKKCNQMKTASTVFFKPIKLKKDGLSGSCRECENEIRNQKNRKLNEPKLIERKKEREQWLFPEPNKKRCTKCEEVKLLDKFYLNHPYGGLRSQCIDCHQVSEKKYRKEHSQSIKIYRRNLRAKRKLQVLVHYGGKVPSCACCGELNFEFLAIDHIQGGGSKERKKVGTGFSFFQFLINNNFPQGYRVLCHNCNMSYGLYGYCSHKKEIRI
jgi:hypothetical protein